MVTSKQTYPPLTDEEEAEIQAEILADPEHPELTDEELATARPFAEVFPELAESIRRLRERDASSLEQVSLHLDREVIARFRATGEGWEDRINAVLKAAVLED